MATILDGKATAAIIRAEIKNEIAEFYKKYRVSPGLAVVLVGEDPASAVYVRNKHRACTEVGIYSEMHVLPADTTEEKLLSLIEQLNQDKRIHGILVQLPLPKHISEKRVLHAIAPNKDVDAFHPWNVGQLFLGEPTFLPCTPAGIITLLHHYGISPDGKRCVVVGRSNIVGKPMAMLLLAENGTVSICHSHTQNLAAYTRDADILVVAVGKPLFMTGEMIKKGAVVIDVGIHRSSEGKLCGDVDFSSVEPHAGAITPVPGGVGPMTIAMLLRNTLRAAMLQYENN